jgi:ubiquinone/menaquinone biosynthesis C-methylase UbiE
MRCLQGRVIRPEILDELGPEEAAASVADLVRINRYLGGHEATRRIFGEVAQAGDEFSVLDVGAASGDMGAIIRAAFPRARVTALDYKLSHLANAPQPRIAADAFAPPLRDGSFDFTFCSLFLHHFTNDRIVQLLKSFKRLARRQVIINDLERNPLAYYFLPATRRLFGWDPITVHDGTRSVEAGFHADELKELAEAAGLRNIKIRRHRPAFRITLAGEV